MFYVYPGVNLAGVEPDRVKLSISSHVTRGPNAKSWIYLNKTYNDRACSAFKDSGEKKSNTYLKLLIQQDHLIKWSQKSHQMINKWSLTGH